MSAGALGVLMGAGWADAAGGVLVAAVWQGLVLVSVVAMLLRLLPGLSAGVRGRLWLGVLAALVLLPGLEMVLPVLAPVRNETGVRVAQGWSLALVGIWAVMMATRGLGLLASAVRVGRIAREARRVEAPEGVRALLAGMELCLSDEAGRPSVVGWRRPRILLPPAMWAEMTEEELRQVVLHEMEHVRRGDQWSNLLQKAAVALMPLSPAALWVERRLCLERELACDDGVLRVGGGRKAYATCLARLAELSVLRRGAWLALGAWERQSELGRRVTRLLRGPEEGVSPGRRRAAVAAVMSGVLMGGAGLARAPRLLSFGPGSSLEVAEATAGMQDSGGIAPTAGRAIVASAWGRGGHMVLASARIPTPTARGTALQADRMVARAGQGLRVGGRRVPAARKAASPRVAAVRPPTVRRVVGIAAARRRATDEWISFTSVDAGAARMRSAVAVPVLAVPVENESLPSYAAVPMADGWLVIQL